MAVTIGTSWTNIASYNWQPGTGFNITFYLDARYSSTKNNIANNESYIYTRMTSVVHAGSGSGSRYNFWCNHAPTVSGSGTWYFGNETITEGSKTTIPHNADGTKTLTINAGGSVSGVGLSFSMSANVKLETIPRTTKLANQTATIGELKNITWTRASSSFTHTLAYTFGSVTETIGTKLTTSVDFTPSEKLYKEMTTSSSKTGTLTLTTYSGGTKIGSSTATLTLKAKEDVVKPVVNESYVRDINNQTLTLTGDANVLISNHSSPFIELNINSLYYAKLKNITVNDIILDLPEGTTTEETPDVTNYILQQDLSKATTDTFNIVIVDSRGITTKHEIKTDFIDYIELNCIPVFKRTQPTTGEVGLEFDGKYFNNTFGDVDNSLSIRYTYKVKDTEEYLDDILLIENTDYKIIDNTFHSGSEEYKSILNLGSIFDYKKAYQFVLYVEDALTSLVINVLVVKGIPIFWWNGEQVTINGDLYIADTDGNNPINVKSLTGGGYDSLPVGSILPFSNENPPIGYLMCDGSEISRDSYKELFEVIGTSFGNGNGSTTFNLPNLNGKVPVGKSNTSNSVFNVDLGTVIGEETHKLTIAEMPKHRHVIPYSANTNAGYNSVIRSNGKEAEGFSPYQGEDQPHNNVQPSLVVHYIIKASGTSILNGNVIDSLEDNSSTNAPSQRAVNEKFGCNLITNGEPVKTGRKIDGKDEYVKRISTILGAGIKNSNNLHWDVSTGLSNVITTRNIDAFVTNTLGAVLDCNMVRFNGTSLSGTSQLAYFTNTTGIIAFETAGNDRQGLEFTANIYFTYN